MREQPIIIEGPERYTLSYTPTDFKACCALGRTTFSGIANSNKPKLYIASVDNTPIYVGITKQPIRQRLRHGWKANGQSGYHGYAWRHSGTSAVLDIWEHTNAVNRNERDIETIEAEIVYRLRHTTGQWPQFQTEIHFYPSNEEHRRIAEGIVGHYSRVRTHY